MGLNKKPYPLAYILTFPTDPALLPRDVFDYAYDETDQPIYMHIEHYAQIGEHVPLRKTSKLLTLQPGRSFNQPSSRAQQSTPSITRSGRLPLTFPSQIDRGSNTAAHRHQLALSDYFPEDDASDSSH